MVSNSELIGTLAIVGVPLVVSVIALVKPIIELNTSITKLNVTIRQLTDDNDGFKEELKDQAELINDHEKRLYYIEHKE